MPSLPHTILQLWSFFYSREAFAMLAPGLNGLEVFVVGPIVIAFAAAVAALVVGTLMIAAYPVIAAKSGKRPVQIVCTLALLVIGAITLAELLETTILGYNGAVTGALAGQRPLNGVEYCSYFILAVLFALVAVKWPTLCEALVAGMFGPEPERRSSFLEYGQRLAVAAATRIVREGRRKS